MKFLNQFTVFDWKSFAAGKQFTVTGVSEYTDYDNGDHLGTKIDAVITEDKTAYKQKDGESATNKFEKIAFKCNKDVEIPLDAVVEPKGVMATVYGEFRNMLSIKCADVVVIGGVKEKTNE